MIAQEKLDREELLNLLASNAYRYGDFTLSSGKKSNHYVNCKPVSLSSKGLILLSRALLNKVDTSAIAVAGMTLGADPLVSGVSFEAALKQRNLDALIIRKEPKGHGTEAWLEGPLPSKGSLVTVLEDVVTTGGSSLEAVNRLTEAGFKVRKIVAIVDRNEGALNNILKANLTLDSLFSIKEISDRACELKL